LLFLLIFWIFDFFLFSGLSVLSLLPYLAVPLLPVDQTPDARPKEIEIEQCTRQTDIACL